MKFLHRLKSIALIFLGTGFAFSDLAVASAAPLPVTDNTAPPYLGVWEIKYEGVGGTNDFARWLNRRALFPVVTQYIQDASDWPALFDRYWVDPAWSKWVTEAPGRRTVIFVSLATDSDSLAKGAAGGYNDKATEMATYLVANHLGDSIICMGLINSPNTWGSASASDAANFVLYWQQVVKAVRAVPGAEKLKFDWVGMNRKTSFPIESAWPGDANVDYVGMILYDQCLDKSIYPIPATATDGEKLERQRKAWSLYYSPASQNGLAAWEAVAKAHGKPFTIPLWCLYSDHYTDGTVSTGGDNAFFVQQMYDFIQSPANNVYFSCYMDIYPDCTRIAPGYGEPSHYPQAAALFKKLFGLPAATAPSTSPAETK